MLVVDDEPQMRRLLQSGFSREGYKVDTVSDGHTALERLARRGFDLFLIGAEVPGCGASDVLARVREWSHLPVIVLSVCGSVEHKVGWLQAGADDVVEKPFAIEELTARAYALLRRSETTGSSPVLTFDELQVDLSRRLVLLGGESLHFTPTEYRLLEVLVRNATKLLTQEFLLREVWGPGYSKEHEYVRTYVAQLRAKLGDRASCPRWIATEPWVGYRWLVEPEANPCSASPPPRRDVAGGGRTTRSLGLSKHQVHKVAGEEGRQREHEEA
ncbi:MAG: response regulator transcription factor [Actinobacteria bacterium]|nr:response regulator transcription factor [Actinomycetota bacterium]